MSRREEMLVLYDQGKTPKQISFMLNVHISSVYRALIYYGRAHKRGYRQVSTIDVSYLRPQNSLRDVAKLLGVSHTTVWRLEQP